MAISRARSLILVALVLAAPLGGQERHVVHRLDGGRGEVVVALGAHFGPGRFDPAGQEVVVLAGGRRRRAQIAELARHADGSMARARLTLPLDPDARGQGVELRTAPRRERQPSAFRLVEEADGLRVSNGVLRFLVPRDPAVALRDLALERAGEPALATLAVGEARGEAELDLEEDGPYRLIVRQRGRVAAGPEEQPLCVDRRLVLDRRSATLLVETWLAAEGAAMPSAALEHALELGFAPRRLVVANEALRPAELDCELLIDQGGRARRAALAAAIAAEGLLLQGDGQALRIEVEDLLERGPGRIALAGRALVLPLVSADYRWRAGRSASRRLAISLSGGSRSRPRRAPRLVVRAPGGAPVPAVLPGRDHLAALRRKVAAALEPERRRALGFDWRGELNWGDWRWSRTDAGNLEYDTILGLRLAARDLERPELLLRSRAALGHLLRVDRAPGGLPFRHGGGHVGGLEAGHIWLEGALREAMAEADPFLVERVEESIAAWRGRLLAMRPERELLRSLAWSSHLGGVLLGEREDAELRQGLAAVYAAIGRAPGGAVPLFDRLPAEPGEERRYLVSPWITIGLLGEALHGAAAAPGLEGARARWRGAVRALAGRVWDEENDWPRARLVMAEDGETIAAGGRLEGEEALFLVLGLARLDDADTTESELRDRALAWSVRNLGLDRKSLAGIELAQLLFLLPRLASGD